MTDTERDTRLDGALFALPIVCCVSLTLLVGAGLGVSAIAWVGGVALGMVALTVVVVLVTVRARQRGDACRAPLKRKEQYEQ